MGEHAAESDSDRRLCFLAVGHESYGMRRAWGMLLSSFAARGWSITLVLLRPDQAETWRDTLPRTVDLVTAPPHPIPSVKGRGPAKALGLLRRGLGQARTAGWLGRLLRVRRIGRLVVRDPMAVGLAGLASRGTGVRVFWILPNTVSDGYPLDINRRVYRFLFRRYGVVPVANSRFTDTTLGPGNFRREVSHLGIDTDMFDPDVVAAETVATLRTRLGIPDDTAVLGLFGRITPEKGQGVFLDALSRSEADAHLVLCGGPLDSPFGHTLRDRAARPDLAGRVHFEGHQTDLRPYYALSDIVVNARLDPEPFGLSVIEGMAMARPVLAHRAGGPGETIIDGRTGWLIDTPDADAFSAGLARAMGDRDNWPELGQRARAHVLSEFTAEALADRLEAIFTKPG